MYVIFENYKNYIYKKNPKNPLGENLDSLNENK